MLRINQRVVDVLRHNWDLGFIGFGGPPTHFQILHRRFVEKLDWINEQMYQELFALTQVLPGPASTKMLYCISLHHAGLRGACLAFFLWSLPAALAMYGFAHGVSTIGDTLPSVVYALLSGLNASTVGIVAVAAYQLSERAITDPLTRALITFTAGAGMLYNALWYFPVLIVASAIVTLCWDILGGQRVAARLVRRWSRLKATLAKFVTRRSVPPAPQDQHQAPRDQEEESSIELQNVTKNPSEAAVPIVAPTLPEPALTFPRQRVRHSASIRATSLSSSNAPSEPTVITTAAPPWLVLSIRTGGLLLISFITVFITLMVLRGSLRNPPVAFQLFTNLFLAGTIIFGGGPVVIPLLREYVVAEGWVSSRDFLLGLAVIQAMPGPNFNFAVYLAALAAPAAGMSSVVTALLGFIAIFLPGLTLATAASSLFPLIRKYKPVTAILRGLNAGAVGLVWTAVYRLWEIGYLTPEASSGSSLGQEPWWVVVTVVTFVGNRWYGVPAPVSILSGGLAGIIWWAIRR